MATAITMPKLGLTMTKGMVASWLVQDGQPVERGQPLVIVMSSKITQEIEAPVPGTVRLLAQQDETRLVGQAIATVLGPGEPMPEAMPATPPAQPRHTPPPSSQGNTGAAPDRQVRSSPAARRLARELGVDIARATGTGRGGRITESDVQALHARLREPGAHPDAHAATPLARRMAQ